MSADGAVDPGQAPDQGQSAPEGDISPAMQQRMDDLAGQITELRSQVPQYQQPLREAVNQPAQPQEQPWDQQQQQEPDPADPYYDPQYEQQQAMQQLQQYIQDQVQQGVQSQITPYIRQQQAIELENKYPDLQNPQVAGPLVEEATKFAQQLGKPELAGDPRFIEKIYLAQSASSQAAQQTAADGDNGVHLEGAGAAPQAQEGDAGDDMLNAWGIDPSKAFS
jgi:hypothetical protein